MTTWIVLAVLAEVFLLFAIGIEYTARRLREDPPGYVDTSRGNR